MSKNHQKVSFIVGSVALMSACGGAASSMGEVRPPSDSARKTTSSSRAAQPTERAPAERGSSGTVVQSTFLSQAPAVYPGSTWLLAVRLKIADGYRVSWTNPGDTGKEPVFEFRAPAGFEVGPVSFPGPQRFDLPDGYVSYGYEREVALFAQVHAPARLDPEAVHRFELSGTWLACRASCVKEATEAYFELPASAEPVPASLDRELEAMWQRVPKPVSSLEGWSLGWNEPGTLVLTAPGVAFKDFFPARPDSPKLARVNQEGGGLQLEFVGGTPGMKVQGVALCEAEGRPLYASIDVPWPAAFAARKN